MRRFLWLYSLPPAAHSTPFLCSCAKKRGGAPKKRAFGCRHRTCSVPPASPTDSKPQHPRRLRQADLSARSTTKPLPKSGEDEFRPPRQQRSREWWSRRGKKALFFGGSTPFLWASTKEMGSKGRTGYRPPPNVTAHTYKRKNIRGNPRRGFPLRPPPALMRAKRSFRALRARPEALPLDSTAFEKAGETFSRARSAQGGHSSRMVSFRTSGRA